jgi:hypothetical protein
MTMHNLVMALACACLLVATLLPSPRLFAATDQQYCAPTGKECQDFENFCETSGVVFSCTSTNVETKCKNCPENSTGSCGPDGTITCGFSVVAHCRGGVPPTGGPDPASTGEPWENKVWSYRYGDDGNKKTCESVDKCSGSTVCAKPAQGNN